MSEEPDDDDLGSRPIRRVSAGRGGVLLLVGLFVASILIMFVALAVVLAVLR